MKSPVKILVKTTYIALITASIALAMPGLALAEKARLGHVFPAGDAADAASSRFAELINERTKGEIEISVFPNGQIGGDEALGRDLSRGAVEFAFLNVGSLTGLDPLLDIHYLPYIVTNDDEADKIFYNPEGVLQRTLNERLDSHRIVPLGYFELGFRAVTNSKRPVNTVKDLQGLKIRVPGSAAIRSFFEVTGAQVVTMPFTNLFVALQQGTVDGQDNGASLTYNARLFEAQRYMTLTNHTYAMGAIAVSQRFWNRLSPENQTIVTDTAREIAAEQITASRAASSDFVARIEAAGVEVIRPSDEALAAFAEMGQKGWDQLTPVYGEERITALRAEIAALKDE